MVDSVELSCDVVRSGSDVVVFGLQTPSSMSSVAETANKQRRAVTEYVYVQYTDD